MDVRVLGALEVLRQGVLLPLGGPKQRTVLALLAASPGQAVSADILILGVYGDEAPPAALRTIHTYVSNLRHEVGDLIVRSGDGYRLQHEETVTIDSARFEELYVRGSALLDDDPPGAGTLLREALGLWRGHAFADVEAHGYLEAEITRLSELRASALEARVEADLARGAHRALVPELEALAEEYPLRESFRAQHMTALYRCGRQAEALRAYDRTRQLLADELGIEPTPSLQALEEMILVQDPQLDIAALVTVERRAVLTAELNEPWRIESMARRDAIFDHRDSIISEHAGGSGGSILDVRGNAALAVFPSVMTAIEASRALSAMDLQIAIDHGEVEVSHDRISGPPVNRSLRLAAVANPGQVLVSSDAHAELTASGAGGWSVVSLGSHQIPGLEGPELLFQLIGDGLEAEFGALRLDRLPQPSPDVRGVGALPGYELRDEIGSNAFSVVTRAYQASVGREVAIRMFNRELVADPRFIRRFEAVAQRIAAIEHPHLVPLLDFWREPERAVLVNRLVQGSTLQVATNDPRTRVTEPVALVEKIASSLVVAHQHGLVHGRVSTRNVLLDELGNPYLSDLGVGTIVHGLMSGADRAPLTAHTDLQQLGTLLDETAHPSDARLRRIVAEATATDTMHGYQSISQLVNDLHDSPAGSAGEGARSAARNPYKGLVSYEPIDNGDFFGRDKLIEELVEAVGSQTLTVVVGPSGIGKSSVVKAGVVPALRNGALPGSENWLFADMYIGDHPFDALAAALSRVAVSSPDDLIELVRKGQATLPELVRRVTPEGSQTLLVIDQFEELFTGVLDESVRERFLDVLTQVAVEPTSPIRVVVTVRADFFDRPLRYAGFGAAVSGRMVTVSAPTKRELAEIVERPARGVGVDVEPALVEALVTDADEQAGGLPLLQHTLRELFDARRSDRVTLDDYRSAGGLTAAVAHRAEQVYLSLSAAGRRLSRAVFLSLVSVEQGVGDTRRRVRRQDLAALASRRDVDGVLDAFGRARLIVFDRDPVTRGPTVEVAHEALIGVWSRYQNWIDEVREDLLARRRLEVAAREWLESDEDEGYLLSAGRLERSENWRDRSGMRIGVDESRFLDASRSAADVEQARSTRARRRVVVGLSAALTIVLALGGFAWAQRNTAIHRTVEARVQELLAHSDVALSEDPNLAINLALEAYEYSQALGGTTPGEVMTALHVAVQSSRLLAILPDAGHVEGSFAAWSPDSSAVAFGSRRNPREIVIYRAGAFDEVARFDAGAPVVKASFSPDSETLAVSFDQRAVAAGLTAQETVPLVARFKVGTWEKTDEFMGPCCSDWSGFSPDGHLLAAAGRWQQSRFTTVWEVDAPDRPLYMVSDAGFETWSQDSTEFLAIDADSTRIHIIESAEGTTVEVLATGAPSNSPSFIPGTDHVAFTLFGEAVTRLVSRDGHLEGEHASPAIVSADFSADGRMMFQWGSRGDVLVTELDSGETTALHGHRGGAGLVASSPDGRFLAAITPEGAMIWDLTEPGPAPLENVVVGGLIWSAEPGNEESIWHAIRFEDATARGVRLAPEGTRDAATSGPYEPMDQPAPVVSPAGLVGGRAPGGGGRVDDLATGRTVWESPPDQCAYPVALDDTGTLALLGGGVVCDSDAGGGGVVDLATGRYMFELPFLPVYAGFGHPGTTTEDLIVINRDFDVMEVRRLPDGELMGSMDSGIPFRPFVSSDGRWATWGSGTAGAFLLDLEAVGGGTSMEESVVFNPHVQTGVTNFTRVGGGYLSAAYPRGVIRVWRIEDQELWFTLPENEHLTFTWQFISDDGRYLFYAERGVVRRMPLDPAELVAVARQRSLRDFSVDECERFLPAGTDCSGYTD